MGKIQCVSLKSNVEVWSRIEKGMNNKNTPIEKKIADEYLKLKQLSNKQNKVYYYK